MSSKAEAMSELLLQLKLGADKAGHAIEISSEWQYTGDKRGKRLNHRES